MDLSQILLPFFVIALPGAGDPAGDIKDLKLRDWEPRAMLKVKETRVDKPAFPVFDVHNHLREGLNPADMIATMDAAGVRTVVQLDGGWGEGLKKKLRLFDEAYPGRFLTYALLNYEGIDDPDWTARTVAMGWEVRRSLQGKPQSL